MVITSFNYALQLTVAFLVLFGPYVSDSAPLHDRRDDVIIHDDVTNIDDVTLDDVITFDLQELNCTPRATDSFPDDLFTWDEKRSGYIVIHIVLAFYTFGALALICSYYFLSSLETLCKYWNLSEDVAGATFMAIGTSAPEIATATIGVFVTESNVGLDTVAGSTVYNMMFITALVALCSTTVVSLTSYPICRDSSAFIVTTLVLMGCCYDGKITWYESIIVVAVYGVYICLMCMNSRLEEAVNGCFKDDEKRPLLNKKEMTTEDTLNLAKVKLENEPEIIDRTRAWSSESPDSGLPETFNTLSRSVSMFTLNQVDENEYRSPLTPPKPVFSKIFYIVYLPVNLLAAVTIPDCNRPGWRNWFPLTFIMSVVWIGLLSYFLVWMIELIGETFFIPESIMGVTFLAVGTSLPDTLASVMAAKRGYNDMAVSNIFGSNLLDLTSSGLPWLIKTCFIAPATTVHVGTESIIFTLTSLLSSAAIVVLIFKISKWRLDRRIGFIFCILYSMYVIICVLYEANFFGVVHLPLCFE